MLTYTELAFWDNNAKKLVLKCEENADIKARRFRAKEVVETYEYTKTLYGALFMRSLNVQLLPDRVGCSCPDIRNRLSPCKHIFAAAYLQGDLEAILNEPQIITTSHQKSGTNSTPQERRWRSDMRPQNVRLGKFFMLSDLLFSETAVTKGVANCPPLDGKEVRALRELTAHILDPVVEKFGAVSITYGYVSPELHAKIYGPKDALGLHNCVPVKAKGATLAAAADILVHSAADWRQDEPRLVLNWIRDNCEYDRLILYPGSAIVCTAWADKPRFECKEWIFPDSFGKALYVNAARSRTHE